MAKGFDCILDSAKPKTRQPLPPAINEQYWQSQFAKLEDPRSRQGDRS